MRFDTNYKIIDASIAHKVFSFRELWRYRDLFYFLVWRDIKTRFAQSVLGIGWAVIQPVFSMIVFTVIFGNLAKVSSDGVPYAIFSFVGLVPWTYFASALTGATGSLVNASEMISKVYFPRLVIPFAPVIGKLVDFGIGMLILFGMMVWYKVTPTMGAMVLPLMVLIMMLTAAGVGLWLTSLAIQYRDINYAIGFIVNILMYAAPVVYSTSLIPEQWRLVYAINPMVGVIESFRAGLLGTVAMPWDLIGIGAISSIVIFISGAYYFRRMERIFADVV